MKPTITNYFHFSSNERRGVLVLLVFCTLTFSLPSVLQQFRSKSRTDFSEFEATVQAFKKASGANIGQPFDFDPNAATEEELKQLGLSPKVAQNILRFRSKGGAFRKPEDFKKIWGLEKEDYERLHAYIHIGVQKDQYHKNVNSPEDPEYFEFDPNTASEKDFYRLGLSNYTIKSIINYRTKGGVFRKKEDLAKIYSLKQADYERLEPYIAIPDGNKYTKKTTEKIDINTADEETWRSLPLIGQGRARQIVKFRNRLGGFTSVDQVGEIYMLPDSVFQVIRPQLMLESPKLQPININAATTDELMLHPYINRKQAGLITAYREQHGPYQKTQDVLNIKAFTDMDWWEKVSPYLSVE
ncbi:MAG: helix-hairpin-helix domain-containing protein [Lewinellaceae bacterium]|nr:helix-hairpin-helix domain-containing protein [Saprospiraceae bacterium]MCB9343124.1 helix-hairpin-helix domain-containing protein [Lewinellaceae bacterium]